MFKKSLLLVFLWTLSSADTISFKSGALIKGNITAQNTQTVTIDIEGQKATYLKSDIDNIDIAVKISPPPAVSTPPPAVKSTLLVIEAGSAIHVVNTTQIDTQHHKQGHQFKMKLETNLMSENGRVVVPKGSAIYGVVASSQQAGRLVGKSEMIISLNAITVNGKRIAIKTNNINLLAAQAQGRDTARKTLRGAAIGGLINGSDGAKDGAKVGMGVSVLTRGKSTAIPAGKLLNFTLISKIVVK